MNKKVINLTVRDFAAYCPARKIQSLMRNKMKIHHVANELTGKSLEDMVVEVAKKHCDAISQLDVTIRKQVNGTVFIIRGKLDLLIRKRDEAGNVIPQIVEIKYDPITPPMQLPCEEHVRQVSTYAMKIEQNYGMKPEVYLQYWRVQDLDFTKLMVLSEEFPYIKNDFVQSFKIPDYREHFKKAFFDLVKAVSWVDTFGRSAPVHPTACRVCPYMEACTYSKDPELAKYYDAIHLGGINKLKKSDFTDKGDENDFKRFVKETREIASRFAFLFV